MRKGIKAKTVSIKNFKIGLLTVQNVSRIHVPLTASVPDMLSQIISVLAKMVPPLPLDREKNISV